MWTLPMWVWCVIGAALIVAVYLLYQGALHVNRWLGRGPKPRDRVWAFVVMSAVLGAIGGGMWSALLDDLRPCHEQGVPLAKCFLAPPGST